jgi:hypothetical protein
MPTHQDRFVRPSGICRATETRHAAQKAFSAASKAPILKSNIEVKEEALLEKYCCSIVNAAISLVDRQSHVHSGQIFLKKVSVQPPLNTLRAQRALKPFGDGLSRPHA